MEPYMKAVPRILGLSLIVASLTCTDTHGAGSGAATFHVATNGNDAWSGRSAQPDANRTDGPFATLPAACRAARSIGAGLTRTIVVHGGDYFLNEPVTLTHEDSGLTLSTAPGAKACLYGGREVSGWQPDGDGLYAASLPGVREGAWDFRAL